MAQRLITAKIKDAKSGKTATIGTWVGVPDNYRTPSKTNGYQLAMSKRNGGNTVRHFTRPTIA